MEKNKKIGFFLTAQSQKEHEIIWLKKLCEDELRLGLTTIEIVSPNFPLTSSLKQEMTIKSYFDDLSDMSLASAVIVPPVKLFCDYFSEALLNFIFDKVAKGGSIYVPYCHEKVAKDTGYWSIEWLRKIIGKEQILHKDKNIAVFEKKSLGHLNKSVFQFFTSQFNVIKKAAAQKPDLSKIMENWANEPYVSFSSTHFAQPSYLEASIPHPENDSEIFSKFIAYRSFGVSYKAEAVKRFISRMIPDQKSLKLLDIGGGLGFVGAEILLNNLSVEMLISCEPVIDGLGITQALLNNFKAELSGRYEHVVSTGEAFEFKREFDVVYEFATLLFIPRESLASFLKRAWNALTPGGLLIIHENMRREQYRDKSYYELIFTSDELDAYLVELGQIQYFRSSDFAPMKKSDVKDLTVFRVLQKPS